MADSGADPHVSLVIWESLDVERAAAEVAALAAETEPVPVSFTEIRTFGAEVVYLVPARSARLIDLQARAHARLAPCGADAWAHYEPAAWAPHCTLAMDLEPAAVADTLAAARSLALPLAGRLERIAIVEFRPVRERFFRPLTGR